MSLISSTNRPILVDNSITDLGVARSTSSAYTERCQAAISKASRAAYAIHPAFSSRDIVLLWSASQFYVLPVITYCSPVWSPTLKRDTSAVEQVQRRFTKCIYGLRELSYTERLQMLGTLPLQSRRLFVDMVTIFKCLHSLMECTPAALGSLWSLLIHVVKMCDLTNVWLNPECAARCLAVGSPQSGTSCHSTLSIASH